MGVQVPPLANCGNSSVVEHLLAKEGAAGSTPVSRLNITESVQIKVRKISNTQAELTLTNTSKEFDKAFKAAYLRERSQFKLPGFRKGKVPNELVAKHLKPKILQSAAISMIIDSVKKCIDKLDPPAYSLPIMDIKELNPDKHIISVGTYDLYAHVELNDYKGIRIEEDDIIVSQESLQEELEKSQKKFALLHKREDAISAKDLVRLDIKIKENDTILHENDDMPVRLSEGNLLPGIEEAIVGMEVGEKKEFSINIADDFSNELFAGKELTIFLNVIDAHYYELPELDDEFARDVGEYESLQELKDFLKKNMELYMKKALQDKSHSKIIEEIAKKAKVELPSSFLEKEAQQQLENINSLCNKYFGEKKKRTLGELAKVMQQNESELQKDIEKRSRESLEHHFILEKIAKKEKLKVSEQDIIDYVKANEEATKLPDTLKKIRSDKRLYESIESNTERYKTYQWLYKNAQINRKKQIEWQDFVRNREAPNVL